MKTEKGIGFIGDLFIIFFRYYLIMKTIKKLERKEINEREALETIRKIVNGEVI